MAHPRTAPGHRGPAIACDQYAAGAALAAKGHRSGGRRLDADHLRVSSDQHWRDSNEIIFIRVVDARSGHATEYRAQRGDIQDREFITTDGRRVVLAETERLETSTISSPVQN